MSPTIRSYSLSTDLRLARFFCFSSSSILLTSNACIEGVLTSESQVARTVLRILLLFVFETHSTLFLELVDS